MFPFKIQVVQEPEEIDYTTRSEFANWFLQNIYADASFLNLVRYSEVCISIFDGKYNKFNFNIWEMNCPRDQREKTEVSEKVTL